MKHSTFAVHTHTFLATGPSQVGKWPTWWYCFTETPPYAVCVHFYRFMELTINPHTNLYNLASGKPRLLRAWDPLVPYNYCFWSPWLWDVSLAEEMNVELRGGECFVQEGGLFGTSSIIHVVYKPCTGSYVFIIPRMKGQGSISNTHLPGAYYTDRPATWWLPMRWSRDRRGPY